MDYILNKFEQFRGRGLKPTLWEEVSLRGLEVWGLIPIWVGEEPGPRWFQDYIEPTYDGRTFKYQAWHRV